MMLLLICATGICTCYITQGIIQERYLSKHDDNGDGGGKFNNLAIFLLLSQCLTNIIVASIGMGCNRMIKTRIMMRSRIGISTTYTRTTSGKDCLLPSSTIDDEHDGRRSIPETSQGKLNHPLLLLSKLFSI